MAADSFDAFISYARRPSTSLATELQKGIERFAKPWNRLRAVRIFRDDATMSANSGLWSTIETALVQARWFILIATPDAAKSEYVDKEVAWWVENKGAESILLVHQRGELAWDRTSNDFSADTDCVPPSLRGSYAEEPRWIGLTWFDGAGDGGDALGASDPQFIERVADLSATIRGVERDTLIGDNVKEHRRTRRLARGAAVGLSVLLVASIVAGIVAVVQGTEAASQRDLARDQLRVATARQLASTARNEAETDLEKALLLAASGYALEPDAQTYSALYDVNAATPELTQFLSAGSGPGSAITVAAGTPDGLTIVAGTADGRVLSWTLDPSVYRSAVDRAAAPEPTELATVSGEVRFVDVSDDASVVVADGVLTDEESAFSVHDSIVWRAGAVEPLLEGIYPLALSPSGSTILGSTPSIVERRDYDIVTVRDGVEVARRANALPPSWVTLPDDTTVVSMDEYGIGLVETIGGSTTNWESPMGTWLFGGALSDSGAFFTFTNGGSDFSVWDVPGAPENDGEAMYRANAPDARPTSMALSDSGLLATARSGVIYIGDVVSKDGLVPAARELRGAGETPVSLNFLNDDTLISASGTSVALWSIGSPSRVSTTLPLRVPFGCSACGPTHVAVNPAGTRAVVVSDDNADIAAADTTTGTTIDDLRSTVDFGGASDAVWLDDDSVLMLDPSSGEYSVLGGEGLGTVESQGIFDAPVTEGGIPSRAERIALRDDGLIVYSGGELTTLLDPGSGTVVSSLPVGGRILGNGEFLVAFTASGDAETGDAETTANGVVATNVATVYEIESGDELQTTMIDGSFVDAAALADDKVALWRTTDSGDRFMTLDLASGETVELGSAVAPSAITAVSTSNMTATADNGWVSTTALDPRVELEALTLAPGVRQWTSLGFSADGSDLVAANEPASTITFLPMRTEEWTYAACTVADSRLTVDEWRDVTGESELYLDPCSSISS
ncbi:hypothetical protein ASF06_09075 [Agreia sp. Leaf244]|uniref:hypothetical protein n=1 Tax=Agreia sp. Leaf244 TaxID=1736305 RepID=UPI0006FDB561|nr:hypothetical protein [Agreia sp. Leaf244]KQO10315.1 hypothetical protein ASF06_09075 [Agreia sp. Leaf244]